MDSFSDMVAARKATIVAGVAVAVGSLMAWITTALGSIEGTVGDGKLTLAAGLAVAVAAWARWTPKARGVYAVVAGFVGFVAINAWSNIAEAGADAGAGLYVVVLAAAATAIASIRGILSD